MPKPGPLSANEMYVSRLPKVVPGTEPVCMSALDTVKVDPQ